MYYVSKYGGSYMKKIDETRAIELIKQGFFPKCIVARNLRPIRSEAELEQLKRLRSVQSYTLCGYSDAEIAKFKNLPDTAISISLNEAIEMIYLEEEVYAKVLGERKTYKFSSANSLLEFYRKNSFSGNSILLFWKG